MTDQPIEINDISLYVNTAKGSLNFNTETQQCLFGQYRLSDCNANIPEDSNSNFDCCPRVYNDGRYAMKSVQNTFTDTQTFHDIVVDGNLYLNNSTITDIQHDLIISDSLQINSVQSDPLIITSNGTESFRLLQNGSIQNPTISQINSTISSLTSTKADISYVDQLRPTGNLNSIQFKNSNTLLSSDPDLYFENDILHTPAIICNDLAVDTDTFIVDSANNRVGIGKSNPQYLLDVNGALNCNQIYLNGTLQTIASDVLPNSSSLVTSGAVYNEISSLRSYNTTQDNFANSIKSSVDTHTSQIQSLQSYNGIQDSTISSNTSAISTLNTSVSNLTTYNTNQDSTLSTHTSNISSLSNSITNLVTYNTNQDSTLSTHTSNISNLSNSITAINNNRLSSNSYYCNESTTLQSLINQIGETVGATMYLSSGAHNADTSPITVNCQNLNILGATTSLATQMSNISANVQIGGNVNNNSLVGPVTRVRCTHISFLGTVTMTTPNNNRHYFQNCTFSNTFTFSSSNANWIYFYDCDFLTSMTIPSTVCSLIFTRCNFYSNTITNNASNILQVIFADCGGLPSFSLGNCIFTGRNSTATVQRIDTTSINSSSLSGTLTTASQPNITSIGTLSSLNVSGALSASSLNVTNGTSIDSTTFNVDATNNRVGINTSNPAYALDVTGDCNITGNFKVNGTNLSTGGSSITSGSVTLTTFNITSVISTGTNYTLGSVSLSSGTYLCIFNCPYYGEGISGLTIRSVISTSQTSALGAVVNDEPNCVFSENFQYTNGSYAEGGVKNTQLITLASTSTLYFRIVLLSKGTTSSFRLNQSYSGNALNCGKAWYIKLA